MAQPATTTNFILDQLREVGIIGETDEKLAQVYDGYETDDKKYLAVCRSYLIDYYCAVVTDQKRVEQLGVPAVFDANLLPVINDKIARVLEETEPQTKTEYNTSMQKYRDLLQEYLEKKKQSCKRAKVLGFKDVECSQYVEGLSRYLTYVPFKFVTLDEVDVHFVGSLEIDQYNTTAKTFIPTKTAEEKLEGKFNSFINEDLYSLDNYWKLGENPEIQNIDVLNNGGVAISYGNGLDGYGKTFKMCEHFISGGWKIYHVEMFCPNNITNNNKDIQPTIDFPTLRKSLITGTRRELSVSLDYLRETVYNRPEPDNKDNLKGYFNGTMIIRMKHSNISSYLELFTLASRDDFNDIACNVKLTDNKTLCKIKTTEEALTGNNPDTLLVIQHQNKSATKTQNKSATKTQDYMRRSIYTTDMYHALHYEIYRFTNRSDDFTVNAQPTKDNLYPFRMTSFKTTYDIDQKLDEDLTASNKVYSPAIIIDRFRKALSTTGASKVHIFATLKNDNSQDVRTTIANMKTIAYANRLRYQNQPKGPKAPVKAGGRVRHKSQRRRP